MLDRRTAGIFALIGAALLVGAVPSERWRSWLLFFLGLLALGFSAFCLLGDRLWHRPALRIHSPHTEPRFHHRIMAATMNPYGISTGFTSASYGIGTGFGSLVSVTTSTNDMPGIVPKGPIDDPMHYAYVKVENVGKPGCPLATKVIARLHFADRDVLHGRWSHASPVVTAQTLMRANEIELAANKNPADLDVACMYDGDNRIYASTDHNVHFAPDDLRYNELPAPCEVRVEVLAANCRPVSAKFVVDIMDGQLTIVTKPRVAWYRGTFRRVPAAIWRLIRWLWTPIWWLWTGVLWVTRWLRATFR